MSQIKKENAENLIEKCIETLIKDGLTKKQVLSGINTWIKENDSKSKVASF